MSEFDSYLQPQDLWFSELHKGDVGLKFRIKDVLYAENSKFQKIMVVNSRELGKVLILYGSIMFSELDEYFYHEMIAHVPLFTHKNPEKVLIIGGGDGGTLREVCRHREVQKIDLVEIDRKVVEISKKFFPKMATGFKDKRLSVFFEDGMKYLQRENKKYDVVLVDSADPVGPARVLFTRKFFAKIKSHLNRGGIVVSQTESPIFHANFIRKFYASLRTVFSHVSMYITYVPVYPGSMWSFCFCSNKETTTEPRIADIKNISDKLRFYNAEIHRASFALPTFVKRLMGRNEIPL